MRVLTVDEIPDIERLIKSRTCLYCSKILSPKIKLDFCSARCKKAYEEKDRVAGIPDKDISIPETILCSRCGKCYSRTSLPERCDCGEVLKEDRLIKCPHPSCGKEQEFNKQKTHCVFCGGNLTVKCIFCYQEQFLYGESLYNFCVHCGIPRKQMCPECRKENPVCLEGRIKCSHCGLALRNCSVCRRCYPLTVLKCQNNYCSNRDVFWTEEASGGNSSWENMGGDAFYINCVTDLICFNTAEQLWKYELPDKHRLLPPVNKSGIAVVASREGEVFSFAESGDDMQRLGTSTDFIHPPLLLNKIKLESEITAFPCIRETTVYLGLSSGQIVTMKLDIWETKEFASGLSEVVFLSAYRDRIFAINRQGDLILLDLQGSRLFTHYIKIPEGSRFLSLLPLLFHEDKVYYIYNYKIGRNEVKSCILELNLADEESHSVAEYEDIINEASLYDEKFFISLRNDLLIMSLKGDKLESFSLNSSLNVPMSIDRKKSRLVYTNRNQVESRKFDGSALSRRLRLSGERVIKTPPIILDRNLVYADNSFLYMNDSIVSVTLNGMPAPYLSYANGKIFLTTEAGGIYAFRLVQQD